jgi:hypothetical protein
MKGGIPEHDLSKFLETISLGACFNFGCTTCGGSSGLNRINDWILAHTQSNGEGRIADLAGALHGVRLNRHNSRGLNLFLHHLSRNWFREWETDLVGPEARQSQALQEAIADANERLMARENRRCAAFRRWERRQPPAYHQAKAERLEQARRREEGRMERERLHSLRNNSRWVSAYRQAKRARKASAHADRRLAKVERELTAGRRGAAATKPPANQCPDPQHESKRAEDRPRPFRT